MVIGVSPDVPEVLRKFRARHDLPFILLSDSDHQVAEAYGVWGEKRMYGKSSFGILRSHFVLDEAGVVLDAQVRISPAESVQKAVAVLVGSP